MSTLGWILASTTAMAAIAWIGLLTFSLREGAFRRVLRPLVAFAAGSLLGGAVLHLLPEALPRFDDPTPVMLWFLAGFVLFLVLEQFLDWHHGHGPRAAASGRSSMTYLLLLADGLHNFLGGLAIGGSFLISPPVGAVTCVAAAAHEIPQELGDYAILVQSGWERKRALTANFLSALTIVPGGVLAWAAGARLDVTFLLPLAAGNFVYIASSDLIPEIKHAEGVGERLVHVLAFLAGLGLLGLVRYALG